MEFRGIEEQSGQVLALEESLPREELVRRRHPAIEQDVQPDDLNAFVGRLLEFW